MNLYKVSTIGLLTGIVIACGAAGSDHTSVARANDAGAGAAEACECVGQPGPQGVQGPPGPSGPAGKDAICTSDMNNCPPGVPGAAGPVGPAGPQGPKGDPGVNGAPGAKGLDGAQGERGAIGAQGPQGVAGPAGPAGKDGKAGASFTKKNLYTRTSPPTTGVALAQCDSEEDIVISGTCIGQGVFWAVAGVNQPVLEDARSGWECRSSAPSTALVNATVVCLDVP